MAGGGRDQRSCDPELSGEQRCVERTRAAEGDEREVARVVAAPERGEPECVGHLCDEVAEHAACRSRGVDAHRSSQPCEAPMRRVDVEPHRAAEEVLGVEASGDQVRVGERGLLAPAAVARRARFGARAPGPDVEAARLVDAGDRAAARADLDDLDDGDLDRVAGRRGGPLDVVQRLDRHASAADGRRLRRGAADIQREHVLDTETPAELGRGRHPGDGAGLQERDRRLERARERRDAAARPHRVQR